MQVGDRSKEQLINELTKTHQRVADLEANLEARIQDLDDLARYVVSEFKSPLGMIIGFAELLEEEHTTLPEDELHHCIRTIKQSGHNMAQMINGLLLLASSHRLFDNVWYTAYLAAMGETPLSKWVSKWKKNISEAYRFTCLPTSSAPLIIRVWKAGDVEAIAKLGRGQADHEGVATPVPQETQWALAAREWDNLLKAIEDSQFWDDSSSLEKLGWLRMVGVGGEEWVFEGWRKGQDKVRTVWNPNEGKSSAAYALGGAFVRTLPGWFALEIARLWATDSPPEAYSRSKSKLDLGSLL